MQAESKDPVNHPVAIPGGMRSRPPPLIVFQIALVFALLPLLALWPPASGPMLLVALPGAHEADLMNAALAGGGAVLGAGPVGGTMIVLGDRARIARRTARRGILILGAPFIGCTTQDGTGA